MVGPDKTTKGTLGKYSRIISDMRLKDLGCMPLTTLTNTLPLYEVFWILRKVPVKYSEGVESTIKSPNETASSISEVNRYCCRLAFYC